jgi:catechol 2,3-dioxygenase-like lactoylglutathione lyase family enzyme
MSIQHVALETRLSDVAAELGFWALLGFEQVAAPGTLAERSTWVQAGATQVHLLHAERPVIAREGHTAVVAEDYAQTQQRLRAAGVEIDERPRHWGAERCFVHSPAGHKVEVMAFPPA